MRPFIDYYLRATEKNGHNVRTFIDYSRATEENGHNVRPFIDYSRVTEENGHCTCGVCQMLCRSSDGLKKHMKIHPKRGG